MLLQRREIENGDGFAHVPDATIRRELPNARWRDALHLIDATDYSKVHGRARGFRVKPEVEQAFLEAAETISMADYIEADKVNLFSGRLANRRLQSRYHDNSRNSEPRIIVEAMKVLSANQVPFVPEAIEGHLQRLKQESDEVGKVHGRDSDEYQRPMVGISPTSTPTSLCSINTPRLMAALGPSTRHTSYVQPGGSTTLEVGFSRPVG